LDTLIVNLHFNLQQTDATVGTSLFDCAEVLGIKVPTSCRKQGKCKECLVEVIEGMDCLTERTPEEAHLRENFSRAVAASRRIPVSSAATQCAAAK
jgi:ferredoxin